MNVIVMALEVIANKLKKLFFILLGLLKRSLCCFKRRRISSCDSIPLTGIGTGTIHEKVNNDVESWSWEEPTGVVSDPNSVQHKIEMYRQQALQSHQEKAEEPLSNFFEDMTPKITRQTTLLIRPQTVERDNVPSRLNFAPETVPSFGPDLVSWEENENKDGSWEEAESWDATQLVREKRRAEREKLAALKRDHGRSLLGSKVS